MEYINDLSDKCGFTSFLEQALSYPPKGKLPQNDDVSDECDVYDLTIEAAFDVNPCFNIYHLTDFCPYVWNEDGLDALGDGPNDYFNRSDVQRALHTPPTDYSSCDADANFFPNGDSPASALGPLPGVIERTNNTIIGHGWLDFLLFANGTLATIQNMTWNGMQGFQSPPVEPLYVPYHPLLAELADQGELQPPYHLDSGAGYLGTIHTERGLTFSSSFLSGHGMFFLFL